GSIPDFIGKITACLHFLPIETHIISRCVSCNQSQTQSICTVFIDYLKRIDTISEGFTHLSSLGISHQSVNQHMVERRFSRLLQGREYHTDYPEENNIISCHQHVSRVK